MFVCDIPNATAAVQAFHIALHVGLAAVVSTSGAMFLALGAIAHRRARRAARGMRVVEVALPTR
jgi:hypothetical protein